MLVNKQTLGTIFTNIKTTFNKAFEAAPSKWQQIAMLMPSTTSQNDYAWLSNFPKMRRWIGAKHIKSLAAHKYTLVNHRCTQACHRRRQHWLYRPAVRRRWLLRQAMAG
jgi:phage major head subunit gpT-like protein